MVDETFDSDFAADLEQRLDTVIAWAAENSPQRRSSLAVEDFSEVREKFLQVALNLENPLDTEPEPEDGGEQYINDNPAPWP